MKKVIKKELREQENVEGLELKALTALCNNNLSVILNKPYLKLRGSTHQRDGMGRMGGVLMMAQCYEHYDSSLRLFQLY